MQPRYFYDFIGCLYRCLLPIDGYAGSKFKVTASDAKVHFGEKSDAARCLDAVVAKPLETELLLIQGRGRKECIIDSAFEPVGCRGVVVAYLLWCFYAMGGSRFGSMSYGYQGV